jgi:hypothetical protein
MTFSPILPERRRSEIEREREGETDHLTAACLRAAGASSVLWAVSVERTHGLRRFAWLPRIFLGFCRGGRLGGLARGLGGLDLFVAFLCLSLAISEASLWLQIAGQLFRGEILKAARRASAHDMDGFA